MAAVNLENAAGAKVSVSDAGVASPAGVAPSVSADGVTFNNTGKEILIINKTGVAGSATVETPGAPRGLAIADRSVTVPVAPAFVAVGPFDSGLYNIKSGVDAGKVKVSVVGTASEYNFKLLRLSS